jgi:hypothetical protein
MVYATNLSVLGYAVYTAATISTGIAPQVEHGLTA